MKRVYVIDDEQSIVESVSMILESKGYEVRAQNDDKDVVDNVVAFGADLVIVDVMFPEDSGAGFKMARALKSDEAYHCPAAPHAHRRQRSGDLRGQVL